MIHVRKLGRSGLSVSEIGFGAWGIGGSTPGATSYGRTEDRMSLRAIDEALAQGINFFDTSNVYGFGHSEELLWQALQNRRDRAVVATKAGLVRYGEPLDFSPAEIRRSLEGSLRRLKFDHVDVLQLHTPPVERMSAGADLRELAAQLKKDGLIRAFGISVRAPADGFCALEQLAPDVIQTNFNLLDQRAIDCGLLDAAAAAGCAVIARTPLCFGFLGGSVDENTNFPEDDHRSRWPREQIAWWVRGAKAMLKLAEPGQSAGQFALRFCLSFPAVTSVIPGILTAQEAVENAAASTLGPLPPATFEAVRRVYAGLGEPLAKPADPGKMDRPAANAPA